MSTTPVARRRQRSTRLVAAVALLVVAAGVVGIALATMSPFAMGASPLVVLALGAAATRITHSELMQTRRDAARDRAQQAQAYVALDALRTAEQTTLTETLTGRIAAGNQTIHELEGSLADAQRRLAEEHRRMNAEARRADVAEQRLVEEGRRSEEADLRAAEAIVAVAELEQEIADLKAEIVAWEHAASQPARRHA
jgi:chromosome segregation ATPase